MKGVQVSFISVGPGQRPGLGLCSAPGPPAVLHEGACPGVMTSVSNTPDPVMGTEAKKRILT